MSRSPRSHSRRLLFAIAHLARIALRVGVRVIALVFVAVSPGVPPPPPPPPQEIVQVRQASAQPRRLRRRRRG